MAQIQTTDRIKAMQQSKEQSQLRELSRNSAKVFYDDNVLTEEQRADDEPDIDTNDTYDEDEQQDTADVRIDDFSVGGAQPIWLLYNGQILWAGERTGHGVNAMNQFRRRLQSYLDVLRVEFKGLKGVEDADLLEALHGFFKKDTPIKQFRRGVLKYLEGLRDDSTDASDKELIEVLSGLLKSVYQRRKIDEIKQFRLNMQSNLDVLRSEFTVKDASDADILKALHDFFKSVYNSKGEDQGSDEVSEFHHRLRKHLDVLHSKDTVKDASDEDLLEVLSGFLKSVSKDDSGSNKKKEPKDKGGWLNRLSGYSVICGVNRTMSLREFWTVSGKSKSRSTDDPSILPPDGIMKLWVKSYRNSSENRDKAPDDIFTSKKKDDGTSRLDDIYDSIKELCDKLNEVTERYIDKGDGGAADPQDGAVNQSDGNNGIGLASPLLYVWSKEPKDPSKSKSSSLNNELTKWKRWAKKDGTVTR